MPQLEFWHFLPQFFWLAVCFAALYLVMARVALPRIGGVLAERQRRIATDLDAAEKARAEAEEALAAYEAALADARDRARQTVARAAQAGSEAAEARNRALDSELADRLEKAREAIAAARDRAVERLAPMAAEAARLAAAKLAGIEAGEDESLRAVAAVREG